MAVPPGTREAIARAAAELATVAPFSELPPSDRARLAAALEEVTRAAGQVIFAQGTRADALYILREGTVERLTNGIRLELLQPPAVFGDLGLLQRFLFAVSKHDVPGAVPRRGRSPVHAPSSETHGVGLRGRYAGGPVRKCSCLAGNGPSVVVRLAGAQTHRKL